MSKTGWFLGSLAVGTAVVLVARAAAKQQHHLMPLIRGLYGSAARHFLFKAPPLIEDWSVANAESDGQTIKVNPEWVARALAEGCDHAVCTHSQVCTHSFVVGMLAHELGHHALRVAGHSLGAHAEEIRADEIAGHVLALERIKREDFARILHRMSGYGSQTHPDGWSRHQAIERGYNNAVYGVA